jgi:ABC-type uncharacterized transport system ATPase subunit
MGAYGIRIDKASKTYNANYALREVSFEMKPGQTWGLLGRNGAESL